MNPLIEKALLLEPKRKSQAAPTREQIELVEALLQGKINQNQFAHALGAKESTAHYRALAMLQGAMKAGVLQLKY